MSKKILNTTKITNELEGASLFFKPIKPSPEPPIVPPETPELTETTKEDNKSTRQIEKDETPKAYARTPARTPVRVKRTITRYAFEFYQDQVESLKKFSLEEQQRGEKGSMSQMVREAVDAYISKRNNKS